MCMAFDIQLYGWVSLVEKNMVRRAFLGNTIYNKCIKDVFNVTKHAKVVVLDNPMETSMLIYAMNE